MAEGDTPKTFTQDELNAILAKEKKSFQEKMDAQKQEMLKLNGQLEEISKTSKLTAEEKEALQKEIEESRSKLLTAEERATQAAEKLKKESEANLTKVKSEAESWKSLFTETTISREILSAAMEESAFNSNDVVSLLRPMSRITEVVDDKGKPTGQYAVTIKMKVKEEDKEIDKDLTPQEAVKILRETKAYLFKATDKGGEGGRPNSGGSGPKNLDDITDYDEWKKARSAQLQGK